MNCPLPIPKELLFPLAPPRVSPLAGKPSSSSRESHPRQKTTVRASAPLCPAAGRWQRHFVSPPSSLLPASSERCWGRSHGGKGPVVVLAGEMSHNCIRGGKNPLEAAGGKVPQWYWRDKDPTAVPRWEMSHGSTRRERSCGDSRGGKDPMAVPGRGKVPSCRWHRPAPLSRTWK